MANPIPVRFVDGPSLAGGDPIPLVVSEDSSAIPLYVEGGAPAGETFGPAEVSWTTPSGEEEDPENGYYGFDSEDDVQVTATRTGDFVVITISYTLGTPFAPGLGDKYLSLDWDALPEWVKPLLGSRVESGETPSNVPGERVYYYLNSNPDNNYVIFAANGSYSGPHTATIAYLGNPLN